WLRAGEGAVRRSCRLGLGRVWSKERVVNVKVAFCALVMTASAAALQPAAGQYYPYPGSTYEVLSPYAIHATLRAHGLRPITQPVQTGAYVVVRAVDPVGEVV